MKKLMIMLHGVGSDGDDLMSLSPFFEKELSDIDFFSPNGIEKCDFAPFGYQWFSLQNRDPHAMIAELRKNAPKVDKMIIDKAAEYGVGKKDIILLGFSQGTMMSLYLALTSDEKYSSVIGFSGAFFPLENPKNIDTPICLIHGDSDEVLPYGNLNYAYETLINFGCKNIEKHLIKNLSHSIDIEGLKIAIDFMKKNNIQK